MLIMISLHEVKQITPINAVKVLGLILVTPVTWRSNYCLDKSIGFNPWIIIQRPLLQIFGIAKESLIDSNALFRREIHIRI